MADAPLADAPRDGTLVMATFRDPADGYATDPMAARHERAVDGSDRWRLASGSRTIALADADGWSFRRATASELAAFEADGGPARCEAARLAQDAHDDDKRRNRLPWQKALAARGRAKAK